MLARLAAFLVWSLVAATLMFWSLRLLVQPRSAPSFAVAVGDGTTLRGDTARLLGAAPVAVAGTPAPIAPEASSRFKLVGVMAPKTPPPQGQTGPGFALIAVDGKPARAYAVGASLDGNMVLQSVSLRAASIGPAQGAAAVRLELPPLAAPATGTLGQAMPPASPAAYVPPPQQPPPMPGPSSRVPNQNQ